ncbi:P-loop NTPase fold protein [Kaistella flava (ex Peng et al. 2021)]|nr:P-loop NTPase fold protein [Kaistella flava (ex Peng et al. 2021)]
MKFIDKLMLQLSEHKWVLFLLFFYSSFQSFILRYYQEYIVNKFLVFFSESWVTECTFYLVISLIIVWAINKYIKGFYFKPSTIVYFVIAVFFYSYVRWVFRNDLKSLETIPVLKYFDLIYFIIGTVILLQIFLKFKRNERDIKEEIPFYIDAPIRNSSQDILNRKEKALQVARFIKSNHSDSSMAIGIVGKWGDGKTSFMSLIEESFIDNNDYIVIKFRSWLNVSIISIFNDFFSTVEKEIKPYSIDIAKEIKSYGKSVLPIYKNSVTEILLNSLNLISDKSVSDDFENLDNLLSKLGKKVVVFLDDLDRLQPNEVFELLKLIRNTASFKTFNYIVGYEKDYLIESLKTNQIPNPKKYCDKIFLNEFYLLPISNNEINQYLQESLKRALRNNISDFDKIFERYSLYSQHNLGEVFNSIKNLRDAKRFLNEFFISVERIKDDVDIGDFLIIKLLKFCYNDVYFLIYSNRSKFIGSDDNSGYRYSGGVRRISLKKDDKNCSYDFDESILKKYLKENNLYSTGEFDHLKILFQILFMEHSKESLSFGFNHNFYKYFNDEIDDSEIPTKEYETVINSDWNYIINSIQKWKKGGKLFGLTAHLYHTEIRDFDTKEKFENYLMLLFYLGNLELTEKQLIYFHLDFDYIDRCISNYENKITKRFYGGDTTKYKEFLLSLLYGASFPYIFEMRICKYLFKRIYDEDKNQILAKKDLQHYIIYGFKNFVEKMEYSKDDFFGAFSRASLLNNYQQDINSNAWYEKEIILPEIKEMSKEVIKKFPDQFLTDILDDGGSRKSNNDADQKQIIGINNIILNIFPSYDNFIEFVRKDINNESSIFKNEFLAFADKLPTKDDFIPFEFVFPPLKNKLQKIRNKQFV